MAKDLRLRLKKEELHGLYLREKKSLEDIARMYGVSRAAVWKYCKAEGLSRRNRSEARLEAQKKGKVPQKYFNINENFFSRWTQEMAYIFGLLMTDGCLSRAKNGSYKISLCLNDKELLEKVAKTMSSNHPIILSRYQKDLYIFMFGRAKLVQDLMRLGMKPRKSLDLGFPDVPKEYLRDFIRGVFDGDGSVYFTKQSKKSPLISKFSSASESFILGIKHAMESLGMPQKRLHCEKRENPIYYIRYCHTDSLRLFKIMYDRLKNGLYLERKYERFLKGFHVDKRSAIGYNPNKSIKNLNRAYGDWA